MRAGAPAGAGSLVQCAGLAKGAGRCVARLMGVFTWGFMRPVASDFNMR